ncbi:hypothetical protein [Pedobacter sp.]|uniref:hypothetical protein n=1 Tax=Pedobacter sp. TaxID=1411316 RepID=UPI003C64B691
MKTSINRLNLYAQAVQHIQKDFAHNEKLIKAIQELSNVVDPFFGQYHKSLRNLKLKYANTDANGSLLYRPDGKEFACTKEDFIKLEEEIEALFNEEKYEFEPVYINELPKDIPAELIPLLEGFVIKKQE